MQFFWEEIMTESAGYKSSRVRAISHEDLCRACAKMWERIEILEGQVKELTEQAGKKK